MHWNFFFGYTATPTPMSTQGKYSAELVGRTAGRVPSGFHSSPRDYRASSSNIAMVLLHGPERTKDSRHQTGSAAALESTNLDERVP